MRLDAVILGGGAAGLWLLDRLSRRGCHVVLLEHRALGAGQTIASQGIIHGGMKYSLQGLLTPSARHLRNMPAVWRNSLLGSSPPLLTHTRLRSDCCYLWRSDGLAAWAGMWGARLGLQVKPEVVSPEERPVALAGVTGMVARLAEQVICPASFLADLFRQYRDRILLIDEHEGVRFRLQTPGEVETVWITAPGAQGTLSLRPRYVVLTAGAGNAALRRLVGLDDSTMQRRPLHMTLARGELPPLCGHCIDGARTRVTITSDVDSHGRMVWQIGGQVAEEGVSLTPRELTLRVQQELTQVLPGLKFDGLEWSTYRIDRAEAVTPHGNRPETLHVLSAGNVTTGWPTKLALAPALADEIAGRISADASSKFFNLAPLADWPRPVVAPLPWEESQREWWSLASPEERSTPLRRAA